jgi:predicted small metal-binding protein
MGYEFECDNVIPGCEGKVHGETAEETLTKAAEHAADVHGLTELDDATVEKVKAAIVPSNV